MLPSGFEYDGQVYRSLSAVAKAVTGSHWNGHLFFSLTTAKRSPNEYSSAKTSPEVPQIGTNPRPGVSNPSSMAMQIWPIERVQPSANNPRLNDGAVDAVATASGRALW